MEERGERRGVFFLYLGRPYGPTYARRERGEGSYSERGEGGYGNRGAQQHRELPSVLWPRPPGGGRPPSWPLHSSRGAVGASRRGAKGQEGCATCRSRPHM